MPATTARRGHARTAPAHRPRRVSGPIARPRPVPSVALPAPRRGTTGVFERLKALPESRLVDRVLRGRVWIWMIGILLGGIVAMQVSLLKMNAGISHSVERSGTLERVNADLETEVARLSSGERIQQVATKEGMVTPPAGDVGYLRARPQTDPGLAADRMRSPSDEAEQLMANGGRATPTVVPETAITPAPVAAVATPVPTAVATPVPTAVVTPAPTVAPTTAPTG